MNTVSIPSEPATRERLLEVACDLFIEQGYKTAKIRDIASRANANLAAINYHFGSKEKLYVAVIEYIASQVFAERALSVVAHASDSPAEQLKQYIRLFLQRLLENTNQARWGKLIARETVEPTAAFEMVVNKFILPSHRDLKKIVQTILGKASDDEAVRRGAMCVIGQCLYYQTARHAVGYLDPEFRFAPDNIQRLAEYITAFSLAGLHEIARSNNTATSHK